jgi:hypothetical protein
MLHGGVLNQRERTQFKLEEINLFFRFRNKCVQTDEKWNLRKE